MIFEFKGGLFSCSIDGKENNDRLKKEIRELKGELSFSLSEKFLTINEVDTSKEIMIPFSRINYIKRVRLFKTKK